MGIDRVGRVEYWIGDTLMEIFMLWESALCVTGGPDRSWVESCVELMYLSSLNLELLHQLGVMREGAREGALTEDTAIGTHADDEVRDGADHCDVVCLNGSSL